MSDFAFSTEVRQNVILTAIQMAGPEGTQSDIKGNVAKIANYLSPNSMLMSNFDQLEKQVNSVEKFKFISGTILYVDIETTSSRGVVILKTQPSQRNPNGQEFVRTDISNENPEVQDLVLLAHNAVGHKVVIKVALENMTNSDNKVRVMKDMEDRGEDLELSSVNHFGLIDWNNSKMIGWSRLKRASESQV
ncbi:hypothetical protein [Lysinibacter cavernae]|uniref:hypothetical protein n=1 Tax=Lysinibacter cavernae TaxID=1640652 RepID=UPI003615855C